MEIKIGLFFINLRHHYLLQSLTPNYLLPTSLSDCLHIFNLHLFSLSRTHSFSLSPTSALLNIRYEVSDCKRNVFLVIKICLIILKGDQIVRAAYSIF